MESSIGRLAHCESTVIVQVKFLTLCTSTNMLVGLTHQPSGITERTGMPARRCPPTALAMIDNHGATAGSAFHLAGLPSMPDGRGFEGGEDVTGGCRRDGRILPVERGVSALPGVDSRASIAARDVGWSAQETGRYFPFPYRFELNCVTLSDSSTGSSRPRHPHFESPQFMQV